MNTLPKRFLPIYFSRLVIITMSIVSESNSDGSRSRADTVIVDSDFEFDFLDVPLPQPQPQLVWGMLYGSGNLYEDLLLEGTGNITVGCDPSSSYMFENDNFLSTLDNRNL